MNYQSHSQYLGQTNTIQNNTTQVAYDFNHNTATHAAQKINGNGEHASNDWINADSSKTSIRLAELEKEIRELSSYGSACDELYTMLEETSFFNKTNEVGLLKCVLAINEKANEYGPWSGIKILKELMSNSESLSVQCRGHITRCYNELNETVFGIKPTSTTPTATQKTVTSNNSVALNNSVAAISIPNSPVQPTSSLTDNIDIDRIYNSLLGQIGRAQQPQQQQQQQQMTTASSSGGNADVRPHTTTTSNHSNSVQYTSSMTMSQSDSNLYSPVKRQRLNHPSDYLQEQASSPRQQQQQPQREMQPQSVRTNNQMSQQQMAHLIKQKQLQMQLQQQQQQQQAQQQAQQQQAQQQAQQLAQQKQAQQLAQQIAQQQQAQQQVQQLSQQQLAHLLQQQHRQQQQQAYNSQLQYAQQNRNGYRAVDGYTANNTSYTNYDNSSTPQNQQHYQQYAQQLALYNQRHFQQHNNGGGVLLQPGSPAYNNTSHPITSNNSNNNPSQNTAVMNHMITVATSTNSNNSNNNNSPSLSQQQQQQQQQQQSMLSNNPPLSPTFAQLQKNQINTVQSGSPRLSFAQMTKNQVNLPPQASPPSSPTTSQIPRYTAPSSPLTTQVQSPKQTHQPETTHPQTTISPRLMRTSVPSPSYSVSVFMNSPQQQQQQQSPVQKPAQPTTPSQPSTPIQYQFQIPGQASSQPPTPTQPQVPPQASLPTPPQTIPQTTQQSHGSTINQTASPKDAFNKFVITLPGSGKPSRPLNENEVAKFRSRSGQAIKQFQLDHGQMVTRKPFFINRNEYSRLYYGSRTREFIDPKNLPLTLILNSWHNDSLSTKCDWPASLKVQLNNKYLTLEKRKKVVVPGRPTTYSGKDKPYDLSGELKEGENTLILHQIECACSYNFSIDIYQRESEDLIRHKASEQTISLEKGQRLIDGLLGAAKKEVDDDDIEIIQESIKLSLRCPISLLRIETPVKGINCKHPNCFDITSFLQVNESGFSQWRCPHCNNTVIPNELATDKFFENLLDTLPRRVREIEFTANHEKYKITKADDETDDEDSSDDEGDNKKDGSKPKFELVEEPANVISLLSDDEDD